MEFQTLGDEGQKADRLRGEFKASIVWLIGELVCLQSACCTAGHSLYMDYGLPNNALRSRPYH